MRNTLLVGMLVLGSASIAWGQAEGHPHSMAAVHVDSSLYLKAESMVSNGNAKKGRALVDSLLEATPRGTAQYAEGLYWQARLAMSVDSAEQNYRRIIVEYSLSPRVADALLRLGQLELARGERSKALQHFDQLTLEYGNSPLRAAASYWMARALLEAGKTVKACAANADAVAHVATSNIELKNQIDYQKQQCRGVQLASADTGSSGGTSAADSDTPREAKSVPARAPKATLAKGKAAKKAPTEHGKYMVQVAAFKSKTQAHAFAAKLEKRGYEVHVDGSKPLYRVRIGHYRTHAEAAEKLKQLQAKHIDGFVTKG